MEKYKSKNHAWIAPAVIIFLGALYINASIGGFVFFGSNLTPWIIAGIALGLLLGSIAAYDIKRHGKSRVANIAVLLGVFAAGILFGGGILSSLWANHLWTASPPASFALIQAPYGVGLNIFFVIFNGIIEVLIPLTLVLNWGVSKRRKLLAIAGVVYIAMRLWTYVYFVPAIVEFAQTPVTGPFSPQLKERAEEWVYLSYYRASIDGITYILFLLTAIIPFSLIHKKHS